MNERALAEWEGHKGRRRLRVSAYKCSEFEPLAARWNCGTRALHLLQCRSVWCG